MASANAGGGLDKNTRLGDTRYDPVVEVDEPEKILKLSWHGREHRDHESGRVIVWGLIVTGMGEGELMSLESIATPGNRTLKLTGSLGDVHSLASCN